MRSILGVAAGFVFLLTPFTGGAQDPTKDPTKDPKQDDKTKTQDPKKQEKPWQDF